MQNKPAIEITDYKARLYRPGWGTVVFNKGDIIVSENREGQFGKRELMPEELTLLVLMGQAKRLSHGGEYAAS